jgi:hypothetical protein
MADVACKGEGYNAGNACATGGSRIGVPFSIAPTEAAGFTGPRLSKVELTDFRSWMLLASTLQLFKGLNATNSPRVLER